MSPSKRIAQVLRRRAQLEDATAREQVRLLRQLQRDILRALGEAQGFALWRLEVMLAVVDAELGRLMPTAVRSIATATRRAWHYGIEIVDVNLPASAIPTLYGVSSSLLNAVVDVTTDQTRRIWTELGSGLKGEIRRVALGVTDPFEAMGRIAKMIRDPKTFGSREVRAETILRTEVNRTFSIASQDRMEQGDRRLQATGSRLMKYWLDADDSRVRLAHELAGNRYTKDRAIPLDEPFIVGGEALMFPRDPNGSARNTVNCRCTHLTVIVSAERYASVKKAA